MVKGLNNHGSLGGIMNKPRIFPREGKIFFFRSVQTACGNHPVSYSLGAGRIFAPGKVTAVKLTTHLHLVLRVRMSGVLHPLSRTS
jgi:hypothetical protein